MVSEARKLHLIEEMLKIKSEKLLTEVESVLKKHAKSKKSNFTIKDFVGIISDKEAAEMKKAITETCETIDEDAWK